MGAQELTPAPTAAPQEVQVSVKPPEEEEEDDGPDARETFSHFWPLWASTISTAVANFGVQYNYDSIGPAEKWLHPLYGKDENYDLLLKVIIFIGTMIGMIAFGAFGDLFGRNTGLLICQYIQIAGALLQGVVPWGGTTTVYCLLITVRTFIGVGAGGVYPLAAAKAAEDSAAVDPTHKAVSAAWAFLWRNFGAIAPWFFTIVFYYTCGHHADMSGWSSPPADYEGSQFAWRFILMFGALAPSVVAVMMLRQPKKVVEKDKERASQWHEERSTRASKANPAAAPTASAGLWASIKSEPLIWRKLLGTGGSWLFFDWSFYGNHLLQGKILGIILPGDTATGAWENISLDLVGVLVVLLAIQLFPWAGVRWLQFWGFAAGAITTLLIGCFWKAMINNINGVLLAIYYIQYGSYWIPNTTTYVMSTLMYKPSIRGTLNGLSAAAGKIGAIIGVTLFTKMFEVCDDKAGEEHDDCINDAVVNVMFTSFVAAIAGMFCTVYGVGLEPTGRKKKAVH